VRQHLREPVRGHVGPVTTLALHDGFTRGKAGCGLGTNASQNHEADRYHGQQRQNATGDGQIELVSVRGYGAGVDRRFGVPDLYPAPLGVFLRAMIDSPPRLLSCRDGAVAAAGTGA